MAFPTETVYGLGANAFDELAVSRVFQIKRRPPTNPLIVHVSHLDQAKTLAAEWPPAAHEIVEAFWPGPLTIVLRKSQLVSALITAGGETVALRMPSHPVAQALLKLCEFPIVAPSANLSTKLSPTTAAHVKQQLGGQIDMILDGGQTDCGIESTVLDLSIAAPAILRPGAVTKQQIERVLGRTVQIHRASAKSPGSRGKHYAPNAKLALISAAEEPPSEVGALLLRAAPRGKWHFSMPSDPAEYAKQLYATLHTLDRAGIEQIVVELPPDEPEWLAVRDRLLRAAGETE